MFMLLCPLYPQEEAVRPLYTQHQKCLGEYLGARAGARAAGLRDVAPLMSRQTAVSAWLWLSHAHICYQCPMRTQLQHLICSSKTPDFTSKYISGVCFVNDQKLYHLRIVTASEIGP